MKIILDAKLNDCGVYEYTGLNKEHIVNSTNDILVGIDKILKLNNFNKFQDLKTPTIINYTLVIRKGINVQHMSVIVNIVSEEDVRIFTSKILFEGEEILNIVKEDYLDYDIFDFNFLEFTNDFIYNKWQ